MAQKYLAAICGVKNSGKTTFLEKLVKEYVSRSMTVAVIKHDGHSFSADVPGTDTWKVSHAGANGTAVFDSEKYMVCKKEKVSEQELFQYFPDADVILLEGFKGSEYPKIELIRKGNSEKCASNPTGLIGIVTDTDMDVIPGIPMYGFEEIEAVADRILELCAVSETEGCGNEAMKDSFVTCKLMIHNQDYFFGPGIRELLRKIEEKKSIRAAAMEMNLSYTKAWKMINRVEDATGVEFLVRSIGGKKGGSSSLTQKGKQFLEHYEAMLLEVNQKLPEIYEKHFKDW